MATGTGDDSGKFEIIQGHQITIHLTQQIATTNQRQLLENVNSTFIVRHQERHENHTAKLRRQ